MQKQNRVVVDTGVLVSSFAFGGTPEAAIRKAMRETVICVSPELLDEYREVPILLERQGKINHGQLKALIAGISIFVSDSLLVYPGKKLNLCRDRKDDMVLECCLEARAVILITGDKDLLEMSEIPFELKILSPGSFLREIINIE